MPKINLLTEKVYNRIAAGEVVDRPYSVVKELVENAIDAGAKNIEIHVEQGGKSLIRVIDDGSGIERDDLRSAYLPHATSKITTADDLNDIHTLGFRGEAVASIAAVSQMSIVSMTENNACYKLCCNGGQIDSIEEVAGQKGTDVSVNNLFFNTPVRLKFLKSDRAEEADITSFVSRFILSRPDISFTYYLNGKMSLHSYGTNEEEALVCIYGSSIVKDCFHIEAEKHGVKICGYIGNQNFFKPNKSYQSVFLNGRYVVNPTIAAAVSNAYASYAMKRQYPFYVLYIEVPTEIVDVNVHPNKSDVRFADNQIIYGCVYTVISSVLDGNLKALDYVVKADRMAEVKSTFIPEKPIDFVKKIPSLPEEREQKIGTEIKKAITISSFSYEMAREEVLAPFNGEYSKSIDLPFSSSEENSNLFTLHSSDSEKAAEESKLEDVFLQNKRELENSEQEEKKEQGKIDTSAFLYKGNLFNTFLIFEYGNDAYLIDQHAAHERLIYDKLKEGMEKRNILQQPLLLPYLLEVNAMESMFISEELKAISEIGFDIEPFGNHCFKISSVPVDLMDINLKSFFDDVLNDITGLKSIKLDSLLKDRLAMKACKAAIKGGMRLTDDEIKTLLQKIDGNLGLKCPHGRPVVVKLTKYEIEKMFKRIV